jgi:osmotically-inducible protein OsmY
MLFYYMKLSPGTIFSVFSIIHQSKYFDMEGNNKNRDNRPNQSRQDWNQGENRFHEDNDYGQGRENFQSYGNASFGEDNRQDYGQQHQVNYIPDNDDNRNDQGGNGGHGDNYRKDRGYRDSGNQQQGFGGNSSSQWGSQWGSHYGASHQPQHRSYDSDYDERDLHNQYDQNRNAYNMNQQGSHHNTRNQQYGSNQQQGNRSRDRSSMQENQSWMNRARNEGATWFSDDNDQSKQHRNVNASRPVENHRGKGPRNYQRSDDRIREDVCDRLADDDMLDASDIEVNVNGSEVVLSGTVLSREAKRHAEDLVESVSGVRHVENRIRVGRADELEGNFTTRQIIRAVDENQSESNS